MGSNTGMIPIFVVYKHQIILLLLLTYANFFSLSNNFIIYICLSHRAVAVSVIGDFTGAAPNNAALDAVRNILDCAVQEV